MSDLKVGRVEFGDGGVEFIRRSAALTGMTPAEFARAFNALTPAEISLANKDRRIAELEEEVAELREDKARIDFLQSGVDPEKQRVNHGRVQITLNIWENVTVRAAIDAAMERKA